MITHLQSDRVQRIQPSPTLAVAAKAAQLQAAGHDIINLGVGEPDFDTPEHIKEAAYRAIRDGFTRYTAVDGIPSLKQAIVNKFANENALNYTPAQILVSCGCKHSIYNLFQALLNPGDEVIIPAPYWVSYPDMVLLADSKPVFVPSNYDNYYKITAAQLAAAITPKTRLVMLNSPSNPSGMVYSRQELTEIAEILLAHPQIFIASDDIYEHILWEHQPFANILNVCPELFERTIVLNGVSKAYAMTGWRIGYAAGPQPLIAAMNKVQSQSTSNPNSIAQVAAQAALEGDQSVVKSMNETFKLRHDYLHQAINQIPGLRCHRSEGSFYSLVNIEDLLANHSGVSSDLAFAEMLLTQAGIALVPGSAFGTAGCVRLSFATHLDTLKQAVQRIEKLVKELASTTTA